MRARVCVRVCVCACCFIPSSCYFGRDLKRSVLDVADKS